MSDDDWQFYCDNFNTNNDEETCYMLYKKLDAERLAIYWKLEYDHNKKIILDAVQQLKQKINI